MARNKTSKFGVADNLKYKEDVYNQSEILTKDNIPVHEASTEISEIKTKKSDKKTAKREGSYRFSLYMDPDLGEYVNYMKFKHKKSITDFFNDLVREKMERDMLWKNLKK